MPMMVELLQQIFIVPDTVVAPEHALEAMVVAESALVEDAREVLFWDEAIEWGELVKEITLVEDDRDALFWDETTDRGELVEDALSDESRVLDGLSSSCCGSSSGSPSGSSSGSPVESSGESEGGLLMMSTPLGK